MTSLIDRLKSSGPAIAKRVMDEMYRDPFWMEKFGTRGRGHADEDSDFHIKYLVSSIEVDDPTLFMTYGKWLRDLLVARGMCSSHLAENFTRLAAEIAKEPWDDRATVVAILLSGAEGLLYQQGDASIVDAARAQLVPAIVDRVAVHHPAADRERLTADIDHLLSYIADGLATNTDRVSPFLRWLSGSYAKRGIPHAELLASLTAIAELSSLPAAACAVIKEHV